MKTRTITRNKEDVNDDLKKSLEQWDAERDIIQEKIDKKKLLIEKNVEHLIMTLWKDIKRLIKKNNRYVKRM